MPFKDSWVDEHRAKRIVAQNKQLEEYWLKMETYLRYFAFNNDTQKYDIPLLKPQVRIVYYREYHDKKENRLKKIVVADLLGYQTTDDDNDPVYFVHKQSLRNRFPNAL